MATLDGANPAFATNVQRLIAASAGRVSLVSGVRSNARQTQLWNAALSKYGSAAAARKWVAPPGHSNHEKGIAVDFGGDLAWVKANAARFGLHQALANEPWHFEPIGSRKGQPATNEAAWATQGAQPETTMEPAADPNDRHAIGTQIGSFLSILDAPVDFTMGASK